MKPVTIETHGALIAATATAVPWRFAGFA